MKLFTINMVNWNVSKKVKLGTPCVWIEQNFFRCKMSQRFYVYSMYRQKAPHLTIIDLDPTRVQRLKRAWSVKRPIEINSKKVNCRDNGNCEDIRKWISQSRLCAYMYMSTYDFDAIDICYHLWSILTTPMLW